MCVRVGIKWLEIPEFLSHERVSFYEKFWKNVRIKFRKIFSRGNKVRDAKPKNLGLYVLFSFVTGLENFLEVLLGSLPMCW